MKRLHRNRRGRGATPDLDVTTFMNLMVALIPFLLISAVFSRVTILELSVPTAAGAAGTSAPNFAIEVIVRKGGLEIANGYSVEAAFPKVDGHYDLALLSRILTRLKEQYPQKEDATILMEPDIEYDHLVQIMDVVRGAATGTGEDAAPGPAELFPQIAIGDAP